MESVPQFQIGITEIVLMLLAAVAVVVVVLVLVKLLSGRRTAMKACPHCAEAIQPEARICRFCQRPV